MNTIHKIVKESSIDFSGSAVGNILGYIWLVIMTRVLTQDDFGSFTLAQSIVNISLIFVLVGMHRSLDRFIPFYKAAGEEGKIKSLLRLIFVIALCSSLLVGLLLFAEADFIGSQIFNNPTLTTLLPIMALSIPLLAVLMIINYAFGGYKELRYNVYLKQLIEPGLKIGFALLLVAYGLSIIDWTWLYIIALLITAAVGIVFLVNKILKPLADIKSIPIKFREIISYSWPISISSVLIILVGQIDYLILGVYHPAADVGVYRIYIQIVVLLKMIQGSIARIYKPVISELIPDENYSEILNIYQRLSRWILSLTTLGLLVIILYGTPVISLFFTAAYTSQPLALSILALGTFLNSLFGPEGMTLEAFGYTKLTLVNSLVMIIVNAGLDFILIPKYGIVGAAVGTSVSLAVGGLLGYLEIYFLNKMTPFTFQSFKILLAGILTSIMFYFYNQHFYSDNVLFLIGSILVLIIIYGTGLLVTRSVDDVDKEVVIRMINRFKPGK
jgi:stage V sporulation protein B